MRIFLLMLLLGLAPLTAAAASRPADLQPMAPPPPFDASEQAADEPEITIKKEAEQTVEEYRSGGKLYMIKVTPKTGAPYYLVDDRGDGKFVRQESLDSGLRVPRWVIHRF